LARFLRRPEIGMEHIHVIAPDMPTYSRDIEVQAEVQIKYEGYVNRQMEMVERFQKIENLKLPENIDYADVNGLSKEVREKLSRVRPRSLGQASRISGITPAAISLLSIYLKKKKRA
jgi:tRNA uridine 5-carboxymethylaminomethyl modification enzyme